MFRCAKFVKIFLPKLPAKARVHAGAMPVIFS